ncbi:MAG: alternative ribosome rescue aminoacyl-tRNA hydrolase ArfB, partial [Ilumatobacteraceae bacterium]
MDDDELRVTRSVRIPRRELDVRFSTSGGPGGQHANRSATRVELRFDVEASAALGSGQRQRVLDRLGPVVRVVVDDERSQLRNRAIAEERLADRLREALHVDRSRRPTRPTKGSVDRRIQDKKQRSQTKSQRRRP